MGKTILIVCVVALLLLAACASKSAPSTMPAAPGNDAQPADGQPSDAGPQLAGQQPAQSGSVASAFTALLGKRASLSWKVAYTITTTTGGQTVTSAMTQYVKGADQLRMDFSMQGTETRTYMAGKVYTSCTDNGGWTCFKVDAPNQTGAAGTQANEQQMQSDISAYDVVADGTKTVAGVTATCYRITTKAQQGFTYRYCFSKEGVPLYLHFQTGGATTEMTATSYSMSVSNSDFTPPATASAMPSANDPCSGCSFLSGSQKDACLAAC